jgi:hypothetical protein
MTLRETLIGCETKRGRFTVALLMGELASADVETMFLGSFAVLLVPVIAMMFRFKQEM